MPSRDKSSVQKLASLMFVMGRFMRDHMQKKMQATGCPSILHLETLRYVKDNKRPLMRDVAKSFSVTPPAATLLIDSLVKEKLLKRIVDAKDRRTVRVDITPAGKKILERGITDRMAEIKKIFSVLTAREQEELIAILEKIMGNYKK